LDAREVDRRGTEVLAGVDYERRADGAGAVGDVFEVDAGAIHPVTRSDGDDGGVAIDDAGEGFGPGLVRGTHRGHDPCVGFFCEFTPGIDLRREFVIHERDRLSGGDGQVGSGSCDAVARGRDESDRVGGGTEKCGDD